MNVKRTIILPFAIVLFLQGVYCQPPAENGFPSTFSLRSCLFNARDARLYSPSPNYMFELSEEDPLHVRLLERRPSSQGLGAVYRFERATVEFTSMKDKELTLIMYQNTAAYDINCEFASLAQAQEFYKLITRDRQSEMVNVLTADSLQESDDTELAAPANLYVEGEELDERKIIVKNNEGDPVLIFPQIAVSEAIQHEDDPAKIYMYITINGRPPVLYTFNFQTPPQAGHWIALFDFE